MAFDAVFLTAVAEELRQKLLGARIDKVQQPDRFTLLWQVRSRDFTGKLLLSASPNSARAHLTETNPENPPQPSMFCMLLRKHLTGSRITAITQPKMERLLDFSLDGTDEFGEPCCRHMIVELMGRGANLILCGADGRIIDCLRRIELDPVQKRPVLPGLYYHLPPMPPRLDPTETDEDALRTLLTEAEGTPLEKWLPATFGGLSPLVCRELAFRAGGSTDSPAEPNQAPLLASCFSAIRNRSFQPVLLSENGTPKAFSYTPILQYGTYLTEKICPSFSALLDEYYSLRDFEEQMRTRTQSIRKTVTTLRERTLRKLDSQHRELAASADRDHLRRLGDLLKANLHAIPRGASAARIVDFYDPELKEITVKLNPALSPQQNAERYYKDYNKAKTAERILAEQISLGTKEAEYLSAVLEELERAETERDVADIRQELTEGGYLRDSERKKMKLAPSRPTVFTSTTGFKILVGRNNRQNDQLTLKTAAKNDLWLHVQKEHGSHVIVDCTEGQPDDQTVTEAAQLAAYYSSCRNGQNVPVDCTAVKNVKKPNGAKAGMVIYDRYRTVFVTPDPSLPSALLAK